MTLPPTPLELFGNDLGMECLDWPLDMEYTCPNEDGENGLHFGDGSTPKPNNDHAIGNLLQSSFDTWAALEGTFHQPIDMETVW